MLIELRHRWSAKCYQWQMGAASGGTVSGLPQCTMRFEPQFDPSCLPALAASYPAAGDDKAFDAGKRIRQGVCTRTELEDIFEWKTNGRGRSRLRLNTDAEISDALSLSHSANTERAAVAVLCGLHGVDVPVASAILTTIDPQRYTVIDFRALEALGSPVTGRSVSFYLEYLRACRQLARAHAISLRDFDRALWQWSRDQRNIR